MLREVNNLSQATQLTSNQQNWHWNSDLPGFKSHALSMTPQSRAVDGAVVLAPCLRCVLLGKSSKLLTSVSSATKGNDNSIPHWWLRDSSEVMYVE